MTERRALHWHGYEVHLGAQRAVERAADLGIPIFLSNWMSYANRKTENVASHPAQSLSIRYEVIHAVICSVCRSGHFHGIEVVVHLDVQRGAHIGGTRAVNHRDHDEYLFMGDQSPYRPSERQHAPVHPKPNPQPNDPHTVSIDNNRPQSPSGRPSKRQRRKLSCLPESQLVPRGISSENEHRARHDRADERARAQKGKIWDEEREKRDRELRA